MKAKATIGGKVSAGHRWWYIYPADSEGKKSGAHIYHILSAELEAAAPVGEFIITTEIDHEELPGIRAKVEKGKMSENSLPVPK